MPYELQDFLRNPVDPASAANVRERQNTEWQLAQHSLDAANVILSADAPDYQEVIAIVLVGLLALQLSRT